MAKNKEQDTLNLDDLMTEQVMKKPTRTKTSDGEESLYSHDSEEGFGSLNYIEAKDSDVEWEYRPNVALELPKELEDFLVQNGLVWRWARYTIAGGYDARAITKNKEKGYSFLMRKTLPSKFRERYTISTIDSMSDYVTEGDLVLMVAPEIRRAKVQQQLNAKAEFQLKTADDLLKQNVQERQGVRLISEHDTKVTGGGQRIVDFSRRTKVTEDSSK